MTAQELEKQLLKGGGWYSWQPIKKQS
jgi:hypothetical protein